MSIQRLKTHSKEFTILFKQVLNDKNLSLKSIGLWAYLMGLPDDWKINCRDLANRHTDGYKSNLSALNELFKNGYAYKRNKLTSNQEDNGKFSGGAWVIFEQKTDLKKFEQEEIEKKKQRFKKTLPHTPFGDAVNGDAENGSLISNERISIDLDSLSKDKERGIPPKTPSPASKKIDRVENVKTTVAEHNKLVEKMGLEKTNACYKILSDWKCNKPKSRWMKSDYLTILNWVIDAYEERRMKKPTQKLWME